MQFRDLQRQYSFLKEDIDKAMTSTAAAGTYIGGSPVTDLEKQLAEYVGVKHCITCANGTDALTIALKIWGIKPGDAVFVPDFTFFSTAETVAAEGATPVFVDVEAETFNMSAADLERKIEAVIAEGKLKPRVVVPVDLFGLPADFPAIRPIAEKYGMMILEDGAQGFGGMIGDKMACSFGDIATTSFFPAKPLGCYGDGGALFTDNDEWAALANSLKVHGKGAYKYDNVRIGMNSRLDTIQAAVLMVKLRAFRESEVSRVNWVADRYMEEISKIDNISRPGRPEGMRSSWAQFTVRLKDTKTRDGLQAHLKSNGIPSMIYYPTGMHSQTAFKGFKSYGETPVSDMLCSTVLSLPMHPYMTDEEINTVTTEIKNFFKI